LRSLSGNVRVVYIADDQAGRRRVAMGLAPVGGEVCQPPTDPLPVRFVNLTIESKKVKVFA